MGREGGREGGMGVAEAGDEEGRERGGLSRVGKGEMQRQPYICRQSTVADG